MIEDWDSPTWLGNQLRNLAFFGLVGLTPTPGLGADPATDVGCIEFNDLADTPASHVGALDRLTQAAEDARRALRPVLALVEHFEHRRLAPYEREFVRRLKALSARLPVVGETPGVAPMTLTEPLVSALANCLVAETQQLLSSAPNAREWYRLMDVIAPGQIPPVPQRYIKTRALESLSVDWEAIEVGLWVEDVSRQIDGAG